MRVVVFMHVHGKARDTDSATVFKFGPVDRLAARAVMPREIAA